MSWKSQGLPYCVREPIWVCVGLLAMTGQMTGLAGRPVTLPVQLVEEGGSVGKP